MGAPQQQLQGIASLGVEVTVSHGRRSAHGVDVQCVLSASNAVCGALLFFRSPQSIQFMMSHAHQDAMPSVDGTSLEHYDWRIRFCVKLSHCQGQQRPHMMHHMCGMSLRGGKFLPMSKRRTPQPKSRIIALDSELPRRAMDILTQTRGGMISTARLKSHVDSRWD